LDVELDASELARLQGGAGVYLVQATAGEKRVA